MKHMKTSKNGIETPKQQLNISMDNIIIPNLISGAALGFVFIPLAVLSFGTLKNEQMNNAAGLQTLLKSIGGSIGISIVGTLLSRYAQIHQANMVSHLNPYNPVFQHKTAAIGHFLSLHMNPVTAVTKAKFLIYGSLLQQSYLWSFIDNFRLYALICLILTPTAFLLKNVKHKKDSADVASLH